MRLQEVERGDNFAHRLLIKFISKVSGMRLPDAARIVMYHQDFYGDPMSSWTQAAMRGESAWSVGERELMAAITAKWNACTFCIGAHGAIASLVFEKTVVKSTLENFRQADLPDKLKAVLVFLEILVLRPDKLTKEDARTALNNGVTPDELEDAIAVAALFGITVRAADTFSFAIMNDKDLERGAKRMLAQGYVFKKEKTVGHPDHRVFAEALSRRIFEGPGVTDTILRQKMRNRATGGSPIEPPYDDLALTIGEAAYKVTDEQVAKVLKEAGNEHAAFELIISAAAGAGLYRWRVGLEVLKEVLAVKS
jgi:uncharacterized peroxidase-related enzyme